MTFCMHPVNDHKFASSMNYDILKHKENEGRVIKWLIVSRLKVSRKRIVPVINEQRIIL